MLALDLEVVRKEPRKVCKIMQGGTADAPTGLIDIAERVLAFEQKRPARRLDATPPKVRADQIAELPVWSLLEKHDLLARLGEHRGKNRAGGAGANNDGVYFFVRHVTTSWSARCGACRECRDWHNRPWCRRRHRRHRCARSDRRAVRAALASRQSCSAAYRRRC